MASSLAKDPESRLRIPHPFHLDADMARQSSRQRAAESSKGSAHPPLSSPTSQPASPDTPISSYIPSGFHEDVVLPMGKYYPSNWEKRHGKGPINRPQASQPAAAFRSDSQVPKYYGDQAHSRPGSDVKRRLQQYQRDMVAQAAMAANALIASSGSARSAAAASSLGGTPLPKAQLAANFLKTHKPLSPRLRPLGSPGGPVTPMSLEADCYLSVSSPAAGKDAELPTYEHWDPPQPGKGKQRRADSCASPVELSVASV
ncbi:hypothetical protein NEMBOFW57_001514 [Staphylotrichum longicolle]|uniref:Uncharacterized protein n=1 Tax=Staphylotrichum longicolle TaxID=669026 RepID=A0AAD4I2N9_9PEZI|nr:hypothetical protein NEMBOFW57_001514 [Staphylotrichum longicolle]